MNRSVPRLHAVPIAVVVLTCLAAASAFAYNPPVDTAGPLTVRIEGPAVVTEIDVPQAVRVVVQNKEDRAIEGTLELGLVDRWRAEPAGPVRFSAPGKGSTSQAFTVIAGKGTYGAHYPIHAYARFVLDGQPAVAHPILILETKLPRAPQPSAVIAWQPFKMPSSGQLALWQLPVHRTVLEVFGEKPTTLPVGWQGTEERTGASLHANRQSLAGEGRSALAIHPPWRGRAGTQAVEFPLELPSATPLRLRFFQGQTPDGQSDGVTFRVRVLPWDAPEGQWGKVVFERHAVAKEWLSGEADLGPFAGQKVRLQLESHPGPERNTGWDQSFWGEPTLVAGTPGEPAPFPPKDDAGSRVLGTWSRGNTPCEVRIWPGTRGLLDTVVGLSAAGRRVSFRGFEAQVLGIRLDDPRAPILLEEVKEEPCEGGYQVRHRFRSVLGPFDLVGRLWIDGALRAKLHLENVPPPQPWQAVYLEDVAAGPWSLNARQIYAGHGNVVREPKAFRMAFEGHRLATSFVGFDFADGPSLVQGVDIPADELEVRPDDQHYSIHVPHAPTFTFIPCENAWDGARTWHDVNGLKASAGVPKVAGRFVFDLWGGRYGDSADQLRQAFRYGLTDAMVVWHNWQRWGYDYRLPDIFPPNPQLGTFDDMLRLIRTCKEAGVLFAPHDNYIDFYPDADGFSYESAIAFHRHGEPVKAWLNEGRDARSYRYRADAIEPYLKRNVGLIRDNMAPSAFFIDVWSSIGTYDYWTADGRFVDRVFTRNTWGELFAWIREHLGNDAPQISESGHDQLIGWLDGAQTNHLRIDKPRPGKRGWTVINWDCADAERIPWLDAAHHDRYVLHGAGYPGRYEGGLDPRLHGISSDDYMATEVLTGHPAMVSRPFGRDVVRKYWLLHDLMRQLALKRIERVEFVGDDLHRQHVCWEGGTEVWVNRGASDWIVEGVTLPEFGFLARSGKDGATLSCSITRRDGAIVETARSAGQLYVNGRQIFEGPRAIQPSIGEVQKAGDRRLTMKIRWQADDPIPAGWCPFVHFCDDEGEIIFQGQHQPGVFETSQQGALEYPITCEIPAELPVGTKLELMVGIYHRGDGERMWITGPDDGNRRVRLGHICLEGSDGRVTGVDWQPMPEAADPVLARQNPSARPIDFGAVITSGACRLTPQGDALLVTPLPWPRETEVASRNAFSVQIRWSSLPWSLAAPVAVERLAEDGTVLGRESIGRRGELIELRCEAGTFAYRLVGR